jgi:hypothetical protein
MRGTLFNGLVPITRPLCALALDNWYQNSGTKKSQPEGWLKTVSD